MPARVPAVALFVLLAPVFAGVSGAQTFGAKAGMTRSDIVFDDSSGLDPSPKAGLLAGGFVTLPITSRLSLQGEGLFVERRVEFEGFIEDRMRYLEIPVLARYRLLTAGGFDVHGEGGVDIGVLLDAREEIGSSTDDIGDALESVDLAAVVGAAVEWRSRWLFGVRYLHGLSDVYVAPQFASKQRAIQIWAGFRIR